ncbi:MAG: methyltransferase, partial [Pseudomonadota bacterium]
VFVGEAGQLEIDQPEPEKGPQGFVTAPGMFSHKMIDAGSALLVAHLPRDAWGALADFGCGWGYLTVEALKIANASHVTLIDAHAPSLEAAQANVVAHHPGVSCATHWLDIATEALPEKYDTIIMNPPFHTGDQTDVKLGVAFIEKASRALKPGGRLLMVANRQLPYENVLNQHFRRWQELASDNRFKALVAVR